MRPLGQIIDQAVKEQYPNGERPTFLQKLVKKSEKDHWIGVFFSQLRLHNLFPEREIQFHQERKWRFDFGFTNKKIGIEIDGGGFGRVVVCDQCHRPVMRKRKDGVPYAIREGSGHNTGKALEEDHEKMNAALMLGWRVFRFTPKHIKDNSAINLVTAMLTKERRIEP